MTVKLTREHLNIISPESTQQWDKGSWLETSEILSLIESLTSEGHPQVFVQRSLHLEAIKYQVLRPERSESTKSHSPFKKNIKDTIDTMNKNEFLFIINSEEGVHWIPIVLQKTTDKRASIVSLNSMSGNGSSYNTVKTELETSSFQVNDVSKPQNHFIQAGSFECGYCSALNVVAFLKTLEAQKKHNPNVTLEQVIANLNPMEALCIERYETDFQTKKQELIPLTEELLAKSGNPETTLYEAASKISSKVKASKNIEELMSTDSEKGLGNTILLNCFVFNQGEANQQHLELRNQILDKVLEFSGIEPFLNFGDNRFGNTALIFAIKTGDFDYAIKLLDKGANPNIAQTENNRLPAHYATLALGMELDVEYNRKCISLIERLKDKGADFGKKDKSGKSALDYLEYQIDPIASSFNCGSLIVREETILKLSHTQEAINNFFSHRKITGQDFREKANQFYETPESKIANSIEEDFHYHRQPWDYNNKSTFRNNYINNHKKEISELKEQLGSKTTSIEEAREETERKARQEKARKEAEEKAKLEEAERKAKEETERKRQEEIRKAKEDEEKAREEDETKRRRQEAEHKAQEEARLEAERKAEEKTQPTSKYSSLTVPQNTPIGQQVQQIGQLFKDVENKKVEAENEIKPILLADIETEFLASELEPISSQPIDDLIQLNSLSNDSDSMSDVETLEKTGQKQKVQKNSIYTNYCIEEVSEDSVSSAESSHNKKESNSGEPPLGKISTLELDSFFQDKKSSIKEPQPKEKSTNVTTAAEPVDTNRSFTVPKIIEQAPDVKQSTVTGTQNILEQRKLQKFDQINSGMQNVEQAVLDEFKKENATINNELKKKDANPNCKNICDLDSNYLVPKNQQYAGLGFEADIVIEDNTYVLNIDKVPEDTLAAIIGIKPGYVIRYTIPEGETAIETVEKLRDINTYKSADIIQIVDTNNESVNLNTTRDYNMRLDVDSEGHAHKHIFQQQRQISTHISM